MFPCKIMLLMVLLLMLLGFSSCTTLYYPQATELVTVTNGTAIVRMNEVSFAVSARLWTREPAKINDYFTTYHIVVINNSSSAISVAPEDIILLDEERNQYDAMLYDNVAEIIFRDDFLIERFDPLRNRQQSMVDDRMMSRAYLMQDSFHYGEIMPNARKTGYIFFNRISPRNQKTTIIFKGVEIEFIKR